MVRAHSLGKSLETIGTIFTLHLSGRTEGPKKDTPSPVPTAVIGSGMSEFKQVCKPGVRLSWRATTRQVVVQVLAGNSDMATCRVDAFRSLDTVAAQTCSAQERSPFNGVPRYLRYVRRVLRNL